MKLNKSVLQCTSTGGSFITQIKWYYYEKFANIYEDNIISTVSYSMWLFIKLTAKGKVPLLGRQSILEQREPQIGIVYKFIRVNSL